LLSVRAYASFTATIPHRDPRGLAQWPELFDSPESVRPLPILRRSTADAHTPGHFFTGGSDVPAPAPAVLAVESGSTRSQ
jgi:hypothetical protein